MSKSQKLLVILLILFGIGVGISYLGESVKEKTTKEIVPEISSLCYVYKSQKSPVNPYAVTEYVQLNMGGTTVSGWKFGTQDGPDMQNGYEGTLSGTKIGNLISAVFSYTIEGSAQKEQEEYVVSENALIKNRYQLEEKAGILVPKKETGIVSEITYASIPCNQLPYQDGLNEETPSPQPQKQSATLGFSQRAVIAGLEVRPIEIVEDSRCPMNARCIWAGTVKLKTEFSLDGRSEERQITFLEPLVWNGYRVALTTVEPTALAGETIANDHYRFTFEAEKL